MRFNLQRFTLSILGVGLFACASMDVAPGWVGGESTPEYPKQKFLTALGTGQTFEAGQVAAKAELSRIFSADLKSQIALIEQESVVDGQAAESSDLLVDTTISTDVELQGVEVATHWRDPANGEVWVLAVLDRNTECLRVRNEGGNLSTRLDALAEESDQQTNPLLAIRAAVGAVTLGTELDGLQARSRVLGMQCLGPRSVSTGSLKARVDAGLRRLSFVVTTNEVDPDTGESTGPLPQLRERIAENLTNMGFQVGPTLDASVVSIDAQLRLRRVRRGTEWVEYRWEASAEIGGRRPGEPALIAAEGEGAESHPEPSTARLRARRKGELDLAKKIDGLLKAFLAGASEA
jgi:hypothetical protein